MAALKDTAKSGKYEIRLFDDNSVALFAKGMFGMKEVGKIDEALREIMHTEGIMPTPYLVTLNNRSKLRMCYDVIKGLPNDDFEASRKSLEKMMDEGQSSGADGILGGVVSALSGDYLGAAKAGANLIGGIFKKK